MATRTGWDSSDKAPNGSGHLPTAGATERNKEAIWKTISKKFASLGANILELGSGTGQHISYFAQQRDDLTWQPSDYLDNYFWAIKERTKNMKNVKEPAKIDLMKKSWTKDATALIDGKGFDGIYLCNVCHIAPWEATISLVTGASTVLREGGLLCIYGPFIIDGKSAASNFRFSKMLSAENPSRGVREVRDIEKHGEKAGLKLTEIIDMPTNNNILVFERCKK